MAETYKILGQSAVTTAFANVYTVPAPTQAVVSSIVIANRSSSNVNYRIAVCQNGAAVSNNNYIAYDAVISGNDSIGLSLGITMGNNDLIAANASSNVITLSIFGTEIT